MSTQPDVYREYFEAHIAKLAAKQASEIATRKNIIGFMNPSYQDLHSPEWHRIRENNARLQNEADAAREVFVASCARFQRACDAIDEATGSQS